MLPSSKTQELELKYLDIMFFEKHLRNNQEQFKIMEKASWSFINIKTCWTTTKATKIESIEEIFLKDKKTNEIKTELNQIRKI